MSSLHDAIGAHPPVRASIRSVSADPAGPVRIPGAWGDAFSSILAAVIIVFVAGLLASTLSARKRRRRERGHAKRQLATLARENELDQGDRELLAEVARWSENPIHRVAQVVLEFDRGVSRMLESRWNLGKEEFSATLGSLKELRRKLGFDRVRPGVPLVSSREVPLGQEFAVRLLGVPEARIFKGSLVDKDDAGLTLQASRDALAAVLPASGGGSVLSGVGATSGTTAEDWQSLVSTRVKCFFLADAGYRFTTVIQGILGDDPVHLWLAHPARLTRERRRDYLRVPTCEAVSFGIANAPNLYGRRTKDVLEETPLEHSGVLLDLSGGGGRLSTRGVDVEKDGVIVLGASFLPSAAQGERVLTRVVHIYEEGREFGLEFAEISGSLEAEILRRVEEIHSSIVEGEPVARVR